MTEQPPGLEVPTLTERVESPWRDLIERCVDEHLQRLRAELIRDLEARLAAWTPAPVAPMENPRQENP